jgi:hypothetical protein
MCTRLRVDELRLGTHDRWILSLPLTELDIQRPRIGTRHAQSFRKRSARHQRYRQLFSSLDGYVLTHESDLTVLCISASQRAILTLDPVARAYGLPTTHDPTALITRVKPHDLYTMSENCLAEAEDYRRRGSERMCQGAILAGCTLVSQASLQRVRLLQKVFFAELTIYC